MSGAAKRQPRPEAAAARPSPAAPPLPDGKRPLPDGWRWARLGEVGKLEPGGTPSKSVESYWGGSFPFVSGADITDFYITKAKARAFLTKEGLHSGKTVICEKGSVLLVSRTRVGRAGIVYDRLGISQDITAVKCAADADPVYLCYYFHNISRDLIKNCRGSTIQGLQAEFVRAIPMPLPPLPEQRRIAAILNDQMAAVDKARAAAEARLDAVKALPAAFLRQVFPQPGQPLPSGWKWTRLGPMLADTRNGFGRRPQLGEHGPIVLRLADVSKGFIDLSDPRRGYVSDTELATYSLQAGDLLFVRVNGSSGFIGRSVLVEPSQQELVFNDHLIRVRLNEKLLPKYLRVFCDAPVARQHFVDSASTSAGQLTINRDSLDTLPIPLPPLPEQRRAAAVITDQMAAVDKARAAAEAERQTINALPAALLRRAFNGGL